MDSTYQNFLKDLTNLLVDKARQASLESNDSNKEFNLGRLMAYHEVVSLIQQQALVFGISSDDIGMPDIDPDKDLV